MLIGLVGKPSCGKSSFFKALTLIDVKIAAYPFTTIKSNHGIGFVTAPCPCRELKIRCNPVNSQCKDGIRLIPVELLDVAGLVPGSHLGKGKGNQFLNELVRADVLIHVVDASGTLDAEGNPTEGHDPCKDIKFLEEEIDLWFAAIIRRNLAKIKEKGKASEILAGLGIRQQHVERAIAKVGFEPARLAKELRLLSKPIIIAANKIDLPAAKANVKRMRKTFPDMMIIPCCAEAEIALRKAARAGLIEYTPGLADFQIIQEEKLTPEQKKALNFIRERILHEFGSTGIQACLNAAVFEFLKYIVVYPVEDPAKLADKKGNVLPDAYLMPPGSTPRDLAFAVHTALGKGFLYAIDAQTRRRLAADYQLRNGDIISIISVK
jgi:hypothetical protein